MNNYTVHNIGGNLFWTRLAESGQGRVEPKNTKHGKKGEFSKWVVSSNIHVRQQRTLDLFAMEKTGPPTMPPKQRPWAWKSVEKFNEDVQRKVRELEYVQYRVLEPTAPILGNENKNEP